MRHRWFGHILLAYCALCYLSGPSHAWSPRTHVLTANETYSMLQMVHFACLSWVDTIMIPNFGLVAYREYPALQMGLHPTH